MKNLYRCISIISIIVIPFSVSAQTVEELQAQAQALMQQVAQLNAQIAALQGGSSAAPAPAGACPHFARSLKYGMTGTDVAALQQFLARDHSIYPEGTVSGYFGSLTQAAVQRFQVKAGIVSSGSPSTTGYGMVGPHTASAIVALCGGGAGGGGGPSQVGAYMQVSPISGAAPLTVQIQANVNTTKSCAGATYALDYGDGASVQLLPVAPGVCQQVSQTYSHTYQYGGLYQIKLSADSHQTVTSVAVNGPARPPGGGASDEHTLKASVASGPSPLSVTFTGVVPPSDASGCAADCADTILFGDGAQGTIPLPVGANVAQSFSISHTYTAAGSYNVRLIVGPNANGSTVGQVTITTSDPITPPAQTGSYGINTVTPGYNGDPLTVQIQISLPSCPTTHSVDWGDSTVNPNGAGSSTCAPGAQPSVQTYTHTYTGNGNYTIKLKDGTNAVQASVKINIAR
jgi:PKD repeat protein